MGTTRVKLVDLSAENQNNEKKPKNKKASKESHPQSPETTADGGQAKEPEVVKVASIENAEIKTEGTEEKSAPTQKVETKKAVSKKPNKAKKVRSKKYKDVSELVDKNQIYAAKDALELLRKTSIAKFDPTVEIHLNVADKSIRGKVTLPHAVSQKKKEKKYLVLSEKKTDAKNVIWGDEKTIAQIEKGELKPGKDFDAVVTAPKYMPQLARVAKILGPRGMMPNPKNGTITEDPSKILSGEGDDLFEYKTDPTAPVVHTKIGKLSFGNEQLWENLKVLISSIGINKIKKATISSTMSPGIKFDAATVGK
ncbi:MAG TPA: hypothetical protein VLE91_03630 [Candidatus Saccharimonadales bacterium]|nr:hypothetical protein [Candidatus Saccharimonadales bacterium]